MGATSNCSESICSVATTSFDSSNSSIVRVIVIVKLGVITIRELKGTIINNLITHPGGNRLLVHSRDSLLRMVDIATGAVIQWFQGCVNERLQSGSCLTPCGGMVLACSEDGTLCVWDSNMSTQLAVYMSLLPPGCGAVHYHPHEHMAVVSSYAPGSCAHIILIGYDRSVTGKDIGLKLIESSMYLDTLGIQKEQHSASDINKLFLDSEIYQKGVFTESNISTPVVPNIGPNIAVRHKKKSGKLKGGFSLHKKGKQQAEPAENVYNINDVEIVYERKGCTLSETKIVINSDGVDDSDDFVSLQTVKNMKYDSLVEGVEDKRLRDIILRMDRVLLAAMPAKN